VDAAGVGGSVPVEKGTSPTAEAESKVVAGEPTPVPEPEPAAPAAVEPVPELTKLEAAPAAKSETVQAPVPEVPVAPAPARKESTVPQPSAPRPPWNRILNLARSPVALLRPNSLPPPNPSLT
jgi:hypothetical protein